MIQHRRKNKPTLKKAENVAKEVFTVVESSLDAFLSIFKSGKSGKKKYYRVYKRR